MRKVVFLSLIAFIVIGAFLWPSFGFAQSEKKVEFILFHSETCSHCRAEVKFINEKLKPEFSEWVDFKLYEIRDPNNYQLLKQYGSYYHVDASGWPMTFINGQVVSGYRNDQTTGKQIIDIIKAQIKINFPETAVGEECDGKNKYTVPILGEIDPKTFSIPLLTLILGLLDGFNPCAMWVLLFLISLLLGMEDKKRMWLLGGLFIVSSGIVYFFFMAAWLQFLMFVGMILAVRVLIGLVAIGVGSKNLRDFWKNRKADGVVCEVSKNQNTQKTFGKIKDIVYKKSLALSILGIILLGFSVNLVELACSAGFPAVYTQVLALNDLHLWQKYLYMAGYIFFYMLDDVFVFFIAMATLKSKVFGSRYAKYTNLIGGLLILILGLLLILRPQWLMFS